jgi:hypothetical protein
MASSIPCRRGRTVWSDRASVPTLHSTRVTENYPGYGAESYDIMNGGQEMIVGKSVKLVTFVIG